MVENPYVPSGLDPTKPVVVSYVDKGDGRIESYRACAEMRLGNSRIPGSMKLIQRYVISQKIIDGTVCTRIDFEANPAMGLAARTTIMNRNEFVVFDTVTKTVQARMPLAALSVEDVGLMGRLAPESSIMGRIDVQGFVADARRLAFDIAFDTMVGRGVYTLVVPAAILARLPVASGGVARSMRLFLDSSRGLFAGSIQEIVLSDGTVQRISVNPIYETCEGVAVMTGSITKVSYDFQATLPVGEGIPDFANAREVGAEELAAMEAEGRIEGSISPVMGNPADPDYAITQVTQYFQVEINAVADAVFDIVF